jgi:hypothetical protein
VKAIYLIQFYRHKPLADFVVDFHERHLVASKRRLFQ